MIKLFIRNAKGHIIFPTKKQSGNTQYKEQDKEVGAMFILFTIAMIYVFFKMMIFGIKACWGISKFFFCLLLLPIMLIGFALAGLFVVAIPILAFIGLITVLKKATI